MVCITGKLISVFSKNLPSKIEEAYKSFLFLFSTYLMHIYTTLKI